jgi:hypothetical protein
MAQKYITDIVLALRTKNFVLANEAFAAAMKEKVSQALVEERKSLHEADEKSLRRESVNRAPRRSRSVKLEFELGGPMSKQAIQKAIIEQLRQSQRPMSVRELVERIRRDRPEFRQVADFDFRAAVLAMRTSGAIESTSTNQVAVRHRSG